MMRDLYDILFVILEFVGIVLLAMGLWTHDIKYTIASWVPIFVAGLIAYFLRRGDV